MTAKLDISALPDFRLDYGPGEKTIANKVSALDAALNAVTLLADAAQLLDYAHRANGTIYTGAAVVALSRARAAVHTALTEYNRAASHERLTP